MRGFIYLPSVALVALDDRLVVCGVPIHVGCVCIVDYNSMEVEDLRCVQVLR